jgi:hypothetical protein
MLTTRKVLPIALAGALLGGTVVGIATRSNNTASSTTPANATSTQGTTSAGQNNLSTVPNRLNTPTTNNDVATDQTAPAANTDSSTLVASNNDAQANDPQQAAYQDGFADGFDAARSGKSSTPTTTHYVPSTVTRTRVVQGPVRTRYVGSNNSRRAYYDYGQPRSSNRSFWQKHRDKLTVAMGTGGGALLGSIIGGRKGAAIGALAGGGGSALYTYKVRKKNRRY